MDEMNVYDNFKCAKVLDSNHDVLRKRISISLSDQFGDLNETKREILSRIRTLETKRATADENEKIVGQVNLNFNFFSK